MAIPPALIGAIAKNTGEPHLHSQLQYYLKRKQQIIVCNEILTNFTKGTHETYWNPSS